MSRLPGERAPVSAPSSASLPAPAARDARGRERLTDRLADAEECAGVQAFLNTKRVARNSGPLLRFELALL